MNYGKWFQALRIALLPPGPALNTVSPSKTIKVCPVNSVFYSSSAQLERDALVQGFAMLVEDLKAAADEERYRDAEAGIIRDI